MADAELNYLEPTIAPTVSIDPSAPIMGHTDAETTGRLDSDGTAILRQRVSAPATDLLLTSRFAGGKQTMAVSVVGAGDTTLHAPAAGKAVTLYWVGLSSSQNNPSEIVATVKLGATVVYQWNMGNPGAFAHWEPVTGIVNDALILNLSAAANTVLANFTVTES